MEKSKADYIHWTVETCKVEALKFATRTDFCTKGTNAYNAARRNGWLEEVCGHMVWYSLL
jgi:hypothetical protein